MDPGWSEWDYGCFQDEMQAVAERENQLKMDEELARQLEAEVNRWIVKLYMSSIVAWYSQT